MLVSIYNVSPKSWPNFRDLWTRNGWDPFCHCDPPFGGHYFATIIVATCLVRIMDCICPVSVRHKPVICWNGWMDWELIFSKEAKLSLSYTVLYDDWIIAKNKDIVSVNLSQTVTLANISAFSPRHVDHRKCCHLSSTVSSLLHLAPTFVYNSLTVTRSIRMWQLFSAEKLSKLFMTPSVWLRLQHLTLTTAVRDAATLVQRTWQGCIACTSRYIY